MAVHPTFNSERLLYICIGTSMLVHALAIWYTPKVEPPPQPVAQFKATLRAPSAAPPPAQAAPEPPKPEPVVEKPVTPPPPPETAAKPIPLPKPAVEKAPAKTAAPTPTPAPATPPPPSAPAQAAAPSEARPTAPVAETPRAPAASSSNDASDKDLVDGYQNQLAQVAGKYKRYPNEAMQNNWEGTATVRLRIGADGKIAGVEIANSSGHAMLDEQASITINKAKPFVPIPAGLRGKEFVASIRIVFSLKN